MLARALHLVAPMDRPDATAVLCAQHDAIESLIDEVAAARDATVRSRAFAALTDLVIVHLALEQELFYPAMVGVVSDEVVRELYVEHGEIKRVLADLLWLDLEDPRFDGQLAMLASLFDGHAQWQHDHLFEIAIVALGDSGLAALGSRLEDAFDSAWSYRVRSEHDRAAARDDVRPRPGM
jgi:hemerythrin HHE cation binding domain-containing protein